MKTFQEYLLTEGAYERLYQLIFGDSAIVNTQVANRFAAHWGVSIPIEIGRTVICRPADSWRGSYRMTKVGKGQFQIRHHNDPIDPTGARKDIPYEG